MKRSCWKCAISLFGLAFIVAMSANVKADETWTHQLVYPFDAIKSVSSVSVLQRNDYSGHKGTDMRAKYGTAVYAAFSGVVVDIDDGFPLHTQYPLVKYTEDSSCTGFGNKVEIRNNEIGCTLIYGHLAPVSIPLSLEVNDEVSAGDFIGRVGNTGYSTNLQGECGLGAGYHLHFEVRCDLESSPCPNSPYTYTVYDPYNGKNYCDDSNAQLVLDPDTQVPINQTDQDNSLFMITENNTFVFPIAAGEMEDFEYDESDFRRCSTTVYGGEETGWDYECGVKSGNDYDYGETFRALYKVTNLTKDHRFVAEFSTESGRIIDTDVTDWNYVNGYWEKAYFWPTARFYYPGVYYLIAYIETAGPLTRTQLGGPVSFVMNDPFCPYWSACYANSIGGECDESCPCYAGDDGCDEDNECVLGAKCVEGMCTYDWEEDEPLYVYDGNGHTCHGPITGGSETNWVYTCENPDSVFNAGDHVEVMLRLDNIMADHRYHLDAYRDENYQWGWSTNWNDVGEWGWNYGYFFSSINNILPGDWTFKVYLDTGDGFPETPLDTVALTVLGDEYYYDGNAVSCHNVTGGEETNWIYTCENQTNTFEEGEDVFGFLELNDIYEDYRVKVDAYHNDAWYWGWSTGWTDVNGYWERTYFWAEQENAAPGSWAFKIYVDIGDGFPDEPLDVIEFFVNETAPPPYSYDGNGAACTGPVSGGSETNWVYTCVNERYDYLIHQDVHTLIYVDNISTNIQYKVDAYKNGTFQWSHEDPFIDVGEYVWEHAYFWPVLYDATFGEWQFKMYIRTTENMNYVLLRNINFTVR